MRQQGRLSTNFWRYEFACPCGCGYNTVDAELVSVLEEVRSALGDHPIIISSGCRCAVHNFKVSKSSSSLHMWGKAADIMIEKVRVTPNVVADMLEKLYPNFYGIGRYNYHTHIDVRPNKVRWDKRT